MWQPHSGHGILSCALPPGIIKCLKGREALAPRGYCNLSFTKAGQNVSKIHTKYCNIWTVELTKPFSKILVLGNETIQKLLDPMGKKLLDIAKLLNKVLALHFYCRNHVHSIFEKSNKLTDQNWQMFFTCVRNHNCNSQYMAYEHICFTGSS